MMSNRSNKMDKVNLVMGIAAEARVSRGWKNEGRGKEHVNIGTFQCGTILVYNVNV